MSAETKEVCCSSVNSNQQPQMLEQNNSLAVFLCNLAIDSHFPIILLHFRMNPIDSFTNQSSHSNGVSLLGRVKEEGKGGGFEVTV
jgi:hypothetical protein